MSGRRNSEALPPTSTTEVEEVRIGCQYPTESFILPHDESYGEEAVEMYEESGRIAMEWQRNVIDAILAHEENGIFTHIKFGYSVPRQNGKNEIITMVEIWALETGMTVLHTAHDMETAKKAFERLREVMEARGYYAKPEEGQKKAIYNQAFGRERIALKQTGGEVVFKTRTSTGGLGTSYDILVIDEAQEYQDDQESALSYTVSASSNPLTIMLGTPPTPQSSGTVFPNYRKAVLRGELEDCGWCEWSVEKETDVTDIDAWYLTNPSLGIRIQERTVRSGATPDRKIDFNIQRLGYWISYSQHSVITKEEWAALELKELPKFGDAQMQVGIKYSRDGLSVIMAVGLKLPDDRVFVEIVHRADRREGDGWIISFLRSAQYDKCVIDGAVGRQVLEKEMRDARLRPPLLMSSGEAIAAFSLFETAVIKQTLCHMAQPSLEQSASNVDHRAIGTNGGFGYKSLREDVDVTLVETAAIAHWLAATTKPKQRQHVSY